MRIGIDVGGTNTDAVLMDGTNVLASYKTPKEIRVVTEIAKTPSGKIRRWDRGETA